MRYEKAYRQILDHIIESDEAWFAESIVETEALIHIRSMLNQLPSVRAAVEQYISQAPEFHRRVDDLMRTWEENAKSDYLLQEAEL